MADITLSQIASKQLDAFQTSNDGDRELRDSLHHPFLVDLSSGNAVLTTTEMEENWFLVADGVATSGRTVTLDNVTKQFVFTVPAAASDPVDLIKGATTISDIAPGTTLFCHSGDGTADLDVISRYGSQSIYVPVQDMFDPVTPANPGAIAVLETATTTNVQVQARPFSASTPNFLQFSLTLPPAWDLGTVTFDVYWMHDLAQTGGLDDVIWGLSAVAVSNDDTLDVAFGTQVEIQDAGVTVDDLYIANGGAVTVGGTPALADYVAFEIERLTTGADDLDVVAQLLGIKINYLEKLD